MIFQTSIAGSSIGRGGSSWQPSSHFDLNFAQRVDDDDRTIEVRDWSIQHGRYSREIRWISHGRGLSQ
jgi:hypothetical protein